MRPLRKPDKHPAIFQTYDALKVGGSFVQVNNHDPRHLREEFDTDHRAKQQRAMNGPTPGTSATKWTRRSEAATSDSLRSSTPILMHWLLPPPFTALPQGRGRAARVLSEPLVSV